MKEQKSEEAREYTGIWRKRGRQFADEESL